MMPIFRTTLNPLERALIHEIRQLLANGYRGCLEIHFPGGGNRLVVRIVSATRELKAEVGPEEPICQFESK
jgi:hypothetical protein